MNFLLRYKTAILVIVLAIIGFFVYSYFFTSAPQEVLSSSPAQENVQVDADLIALLSTLHSISLDDAIFSDATFKSLQDFSQTLVPQPVGRTNPFAPLGTLGATPSGN